EYGAGVGVKVGFDRPPSAVLEPSCLTLLRESLGFGNLRRSHAACECPISLGCCRLLLVTCRVGYCKVEPHIRPHIVLRHAVSRVIQEPEAELRICVPLRCRSFIPLRRFRVILWHAEREVIQLPELVLRPSVALGCGFLIPLPCLRIVLRHAISLGISQSEAELRSYVSLRCRFFVPLRRFRVIPRDAVSLFIQRTEVELRIRVPLSR